MRHSEDGADFNIFILSLSLSLQRDYFDTRKMALVVMSYLSPSFSKYLLSFLREFHLRHSEDGANFNIFILSLSFSFYLLSLSNHSLLYYCLLYYCPSLISYSFYYVSFMVSLLNDTETFNRYLTY